MRFKQRWTIKGESKRGQYREFAALIKVNPPASELGRSTGLARPIGSARDCRQPVIVLQSDPLKRTGEVSKRQRKGIFSGIDLIMGREDR